MRIALFGPPGAGKGTQAKLLREKLGLTIISTGNLIRSAIRENGELGTQLAAFINDGGLVPDHMVQELAKRSIANNRFDQFVLDGFPRTVAQAKWLQDLLAAYKMPLQAVVSIAVSDTVIIERLSHRRIHKLTCEPFHLIHHPPPADVDPRLIIQRKDDRPDAIRSRLDIYRQVTEPVEAYFKDQGILQRVSGIGPNVHIHNRILATLEPHVSIEPHLVVQHA